MPDQTDSTTDLPPLPLGVALDAIQMRVLGSLIEKEITTPEQYPLSLNALINACNQKSSREPVMELTERVVFEAVQALDDLSLVTPNRESRVNKYEHRIRTVLQLRRDETALLCLLLLRGPQTPGELRSRADRLYAFDDLEGVQATLERMAVRPLPPDTAPTPARSAPLVMQMPRQPGSREHRYAQLLGGPPALSATTVEPPRHAAANPSRLEEMEAEIRVLRDRIDDLNKRLDRIERGHTADDAEPD
jgi:uncharacterized protein YceH (UPF0502 family)